MCLFAFNGKTDEIQAYMCFGGEDCPMSIGERKVIQSQS